MYIIQHGVVIPGIWRSVHELMLVSVTVFGMDFLSLIKVNCAFWPLSPNVGG